MRHEHRKVNSLQLSFVMHQSGKATGKKQKIIVVLVVTCCWRIFCMEADIVEIYDLEMFFCGLLCFKGLDAMV